MKREEIIKWCEALESGKYKQGEGALFEWGEYTGKEDAFCCLGVACKILGYEEAALNLMGMPESVGADLEIPRDFEDLLQFMNDAGPHTTWGVASESADGTTYSGLAGKYGVEERHYSFEEIASVIRRVLLEEEKT